MSLCILMDKVILERISCEISKFVQGYKNLCHYSHTTSMSLCGHVRKMLSLISQCAFTFISGEHHLKISICVEQVEVHKYESVWVH